MNIKHASIALVALVAACGGSPTGPSPAPTPPVVSVSTPEPAPTLPVEPTPMPAPAPTPAPPTRLLYSAATDFAHWYTELVPNRFEVEIFAERVQFGSLDLPITTQERDAILCVVKGEMTVSLERYSGNTWVWTINGMAGQASGRMTQ